MSYEVEHVTVVTWKKKSFGTYPATALINFSLTSGPALLGTKSGYSGFCDQQRAMDDEAKSATY